MSNALACTKHAYRKSPNEEDEASTFTYHAAIILYSDTNTDIVSLFHMSLNASKKNTVSICLITKLVDFLPTNFPFLLLQKL